MEFEPVASNRLVTFTFTQVQNNPLLIVYYDLDIYMNYLGHFVALSEEIK